MLLTKKNKKIFIEVKNVTLFRNNKVSEFPDAPTSRGAKHIKTLIDASKKGFKSYVLFLVQIENMKYFKIAKDIDKDYYENYLIAKKSGVQFLAYKCKIDPKQIKIDKKINTNLKYDFSNIIQKENSISETFIFSAGSDFLKNEINCNLEGKYSSAFINGIHYLSNNKHHEIRTNTNHLF